MEQIWLIHETEININIASPGDQKHSFSSLFPLFINARWILISSNHGIIIFNKIVHNHLEQKKGTIFWKALKPNFQKEMMTMLSITNQLFWSLQKIQNTLENIFIRKQPLRLRPINEISVWEAVPSWKIVCVRGLDRVSVRWENRGSWKIRMWSRTKGFLGNISICPMR